MNKEQVFAFITRLRKEGVGVELRNGLVAAKASAIKDADIKAMKGSLDDIKEWLSHEIAAEEFAKLYEEGEYGKAVDVMIEANYPCYEDGMMNSGKAGWIRVKARL